MKYSIAHIGKILLTARKKKGISQRELATKTHIPQSHISKIENGITDLQTSSLIEIARALDLELMLVPRAQVVSFKALLRGSEKQKQIPAYQIDENEDIRG